MMNLRRALARAVVTSLLLACACAGAADAHHGNALPGRGGGLPLKATTISGYYYFNGTKRTVCSLAVYSGTPRFLAGDTRYISYAGGVGCSTQNIAIESDAAVLGPLDEGVRAQAPHWGPYITPDGAGHTGAYYTRGAQELQRVRAVIRLSLPSDVPGAWDQAPGGGCSGVGTRTITCVLTSPVFNFVPEAAPCNDTESCLDDAVASPEWFADSIIGTVDEPVGQAVDDGYDAIIRAITVEGEAPHRPYSQPAEDAVYEQYHRDMETIATAEAADPGARGPLPRLAIDVEQPGRRSYGDYLATLNPAERAFCRQRSHLWDCAKANTSKRYAEKIQHLRFHGRDLADDTKGNAFLHCTWIGTLSQRMPDDWARQFGERHEMRPRGHDESQRRYNLRKKMDLHNNNEGIYLANPWESRTPLAFKRAADECFRAAFNGELWKILPNRNFPEY